MKDREEERLADILGPALQKLGVASRVREVQLQALFADVVGPALATMCQAQSLHNGVLSVGTAHTALAHQLQLESPRLIAALNERLGAGKTVKRLRFGPMQSPER